MERYKTHLCEYHVLEQDWMKVVMPTAKDGITMDYCSKYKKWIVSWFKDYYTECQFVHSFTEFENHLNQSKE